MPSKSKPHQRKDAPSNTHAGKAFEAAAHQFWKSKGISLKCDFPLRIGVSEKKKERKFDLGCEDKKILIECKSHRWTEGGNVPSAKITVWNEAMYYFAICPKDYRKIFFCLLDRHRKQNHTLAEYYIKNRYHLIPDGVEIWEYDEESQTAKKLRLQ